MKQITNNIYYITQILLLSISVIIYKFYLMNFIYDFSKSKALEQMNYMPIPLISINEIFFLLFYGISAICIIRDVA